MTTRQQLLIVLILSTFGVWCGYQFISAQKAISRKLTLDTMEENAIDVVTGTEELHEKYTRLTVETFSNTGEEER